MALITLGTIIDSTVEHYRKHFKELFGITLWIVIGAAPFLFSGYIAPMGVDIETPQQETIAYLVLNLIGFITTTMTGTWITICLIFTIHARAQGQTPDHAALGKKSWRVLFPMLVFSILVALGLIATAILPMIPGLLLMMLNTAEGNLGAFLGISGAVLMFFGVLFGIYALFRYSIALAFSHFFFLLNGTPSLSLKAYKAALLSSYTAVRGKWWAIFFRLSIPHAIIGFLAVGIGAGVNLGAAVITMFFAGSLSGLGLTLISVGLTLFVFILQALTIPLYTLVTYTVYDSIARTRS